MSKNCIYSIPCSCGKGRKGEISHLLKIFIDWSAIKYSISKTRAEDLYLQSEYAAIIIKKSIFIFLMLELKTHLICKKELFKFLFVLLRHLKRACYMLMQQETLTLSLTKSDNIQYSENIIFLLLFIDFWIWKEIKNDDIEEGSGNND